MTKITVQQWVCEQQSTSTQCNAGLPGTTSQQKTGYGVPTDSFSVYTGSV